MPVYRFKGFSLDTSSYRLCREAEALDVSARQLDLLAYLVARPARLVTREDLFRDLWPDVAVTDNALTQLVSDLRRTLDDAPAAPQYVETVARRGYRFIAVVEEIQSEYQTSNLEVLKLLAPFRARAESRASLDTLNVDAIAVALTSLEAVAQDAPQDAAVHMELAMAYALRFESTRDDAVRDRPAIERATHHAHEGVRLAPSSGEAWSTLAFALNLAGNRGDANAAGHKAVAHEPDNWRHVLRLAYVSWGEERLRAAQHVLRLFPDLALAHWLAATVFVARGAFDHALDHLRAGCTAQDAQQQGIGPLSAVGLHLLHGLVLAAQGSDAAALDELRRELDVAWKDQLYARECLSNTNASIGAILLRQGHRDEARSAFAAALGFIKGHALASIGLGAVDGRFDANNEREQSDPTDSAIAHAAVMVLQHKHHEAAAVVMAALNDVEPGPAGWLIGVEPFLRAYAHPEAWSQALAIVRHRSA